MKDTVLLHAVSAGRHLALTLKLAKAEDKPFVAYGCGDELAGRLGWRTADALVGRPSSDLFGVDGEAAVRTVRAWSGEPSVFETAIAGTRCLAVLTPVRDSRGVIEVIVTLTAVAEDPARDAVEQTLRDRLFALLESSDIGLFYAENGKLLYANGALLAIYGGTEHELRQSGEIRELVRDMIRSGTGEPAVLKMRCRDGSAVHVECRGMRIMRAGREALFAIVRDLTERIQTEQRLLHSEERYRSLLMYSPVPIVMHSGGTLVYANEAAMKLVGATSSADFLGRTIYEYMADDAAREAMKERIARIPEGGITSFSALRLRRPDGCLLDVEVSSTGVASFFGTPLVQTAIVDVTERKRMERAVAEAEEKYRTLVEQATVGVYLYQEERFLYVNPMLSCMTGYSDEELCGMRPDAIVVPEMREPFLDALRRCMSGEADRCRFAYRIRRKDGSPAELEGSGNRVTLGGKPAVIGMVADVTERNRTEEWLRKSEKLAVLGELAAGIAHEVRNPLTSLKGFIQLLQARSPEYAHYFAIMLDEINRINQIAGEFMFLAKPHIARFERNDVKALLEDIVALLQAEAALRGVELDMVLAGGLPQVYCDGTQIKQVFVNIIKNGIEAMEKGGRLTVTAETQGDGTIAVVFADTGVGMSEERLSRLGEPFYTTKEKGTGLGMMICYRIVEAHRGAIRIASKPGQGTVVRVSLPHAASDVASNEA